MVGRSRERSGLGQDQHQFQILTVKTKDRSHRFQATVAGKMVEVRFNGSRSNPGQMCRLVNKIVKRAKTQGRIKRECVPSNAW